MKESIEQLSEKLETLELRLAAEGEESEEESREQPIACPEDEDCDEIIRNSELNDDDDDNDKVHIK